MSLDVASPIIEWFRHKGGRRVAHMMVNGVWACRWPAGRTTWASSALDPVIEFAKDGRPFGDVCDQCEISLRRMR